MRLRSVTIDDVADPSSNLTRGALRRPDDHCQFLVSLARLFDKAAVSPIWVNAAPCERPAMLGRLPVLDFLRMALASCAVLTCIALAQAEGGDGGGGGSGGGSGGGAGSGTGAGSTGGGHGQSEGEGEGAPASGASASPGAAASSGPTGGGSPELHKDGDAAVIVRWSRPSPNELRFEQDLARDAVSQGQIQPLDSILRYAEFAVPGSVLSARLKKDDVGLWTYTLTILSAGGRYRQVVLNAKTGVVLSIK